MQLASPGTTQVTTTDAAIGPSGKPIRVYSVQMLSSSTASVVTMRNGTSTAGSAWLQLDGIISKTVTLDFANGLLFPLGCFVDVDSNTVFVTVTWSSEI